MENLAITVIQSQEPLPAGRQNNFKTVLKLQPKQTHKAKKVHLILILDNSGSMHGNRIREMKEAAKKLLGNMQTDDLVSVITFTDYAKTLCVAENPTINGQVIEAKIDQIQSENGTLIGLGFQEAVQIVSNWNKGSYDHMAVVLTDGDTQNVWDAKKEGKNLSGLETKITYVGLGSDWRKDVLEDICQTTTGEVGWAEKPEDILKLFTRLFQEAKDVAIDDATMELTTMKEVVVESIWEAIPKTRQLEIRRFGDRQLEIKIGAIGKDGMSLLVRGTLPVRTAGEYIMLRGKIITIAGEETFEAKFCLAVEERPTSNPEAADIVGIVFATEKQLEGIEAAKTGNKAVSTRLFQLSAEKFEQLASQGVIDTDEGKKIAQGIRHDAASGSVEQAEKRSLATRNVGTMTSQMDPEMLRKLGIG